GVTNVDPDVQDLFVQRINPANPNQYEVNGAWVDMDIVEELIYVDGQEEPIRWAARSTRLGPLISDVSDSATPISMRWTALDPDDTTVDAFFAISEAGNWDEFTQAMTRYVGPSQNIVYADVDGNIGYFAPGRIPIRANHDGMLPVPGWTDDYLWQEYIPFEELPHVLNPAKGYIATANQRVVPNDYPYLISNDWSPPYRGERINQLIEELSSNGATISADEMAAIQADQTSTQAQELLPLLLAATADPADPDGVLDAVDGDRLQQALGYLAGWTGETGMESVAATIYEAWLITLSRAVFADDLRGDLYQEMADRAHEIFLNELFASPAEYGFWCDDVLTVPIEDCNTTAVLALDRALDDISGRLGDKMDAWEWGKLHITQYPHTPFSQVAALKPFFHRSIANGGDRYTVNVAPVNFESIYDQTHVPSFRSIIDLSDFNASRVIHTTGQSGNPLSRHYDDLIERHRDVAYLPMTWGREHVTGQLLRLEPRP
ncbi:MAG: penicillin acylase family protein, partial [Caldilineaceae bacterium]|nr:penicillin acylase family protein [Caldilineaceae bacterium]